MYNHCTICEATLSSSSESDLCRLCILEVNLKGRVATEFAHADTLPAPAEPLPNALKREQADTLPPEDNQDTVPCSAPENIDLTDEWFI